jgi:DNA-binding MarR family transcriptional regulator
VCTSRREEPNRAASVCDGVPERADQQANRKRRGQADGKRGGSMEDARGYNAILTDEGFARLEEAWPTNLVSVRRHLLGHLSGRDLKKLAVALNNIAT